MAVDEVTEPVRARGLSVAVDDPLRRIITHGHAQHKIADHPYKRAALVLGDDEPLKLRNIVEPIRMYRVASRHATTLSVHGYKQTIQPCPR